MPCGASGTPHTSASYRRVALWSANCSISTSAASCVRATTSRPGLPASRRCTMPGRIGLADACDLGELGQQPVDQRPVGVAGTGVHDESGRLVDDDHRVVDVDDRRTSTDRHRRRGAARRGSASDRSRPAVPRTGGPCRTWPPRRRRSRRRRRSVAAASERLTSAISATIRSRRSPVECGRNVFIDHRVRRTSRRRLRATGSPGCC